MRKNGFTLVEISIVLVIIGLIIGGILTGRSMVTNSEITRLGRDMQQYSILWNQFKTNYKYYPGDIPYSAVPFSECAADTQNCEGDGNGVYQYTASSPYCCAMLSNETGNGFAHLSYAGMLTGKKYIAFTGAESGGATPNAIGRKLPALPRKMTIIAVSSDYDYIPFGQKSTAYNASNMKSSFFFIGGRYNELNGSVFRNFRGGALPPADMLALDKKFDDGVAWSGNIQAGNGNNVSSNCKRNGNWAPWDANDAHNDYDMSVTADVCLLYWAIDAQ